VSARIERFEQGGKVLREGKLRFKIEVVLAALSGVLGVVTLFWHDWIEVTGWDPDHHSGSAEWGIAAALILVAVALGGLARRDYRRGSLVTA
jgi:DMSO/TMAO reductase YedYZ heme-binding membrane subunit